MRHLIIIGAGGHGKVVADIAFKNGQYERISFLDDYCVDKVLGCDIIGKIANYKEYISEADFIVAVGNSPKRQLIQNELQLSGARIISLIHPAAVIAFGVKLGVGCVVAAAAVIGPDTQIGDGVIINTACSVDHDCTVGDFSHISIGAHLAGSVSIGCQTMVGAGAVVKNGISICDDCLVGAGAVVVKDIFEKGTYVGVPAKKMLCDKCE